MVSVPVPAEAPLCAWCLELQPDVQTDSVQLL